MIFTERTITVVNDSATINKPLILYRGDKNIELKITIAESQFKFRNTDASNVIETTDASYAQLVINTPYNSPIFSDVAATKNGAVIFVITEAMIDEIREVGAYEIQIRLLDDNKQSRASIPPVSNAIEIREPIAIEDGSAVDSNAVNVAKVNRALTTTSAPLEAFDSQGNYIKKTWGDGDPITDAALNKMEAGIDGVNKKIGNVNSQFKEKASEIIDARIGADGNTYNNLGSAIRSQVNNINKELYQNVEVVNPIDPSSVTILNNYGLTKISDTKYTIESRSTHNLICIPVNSNDKMRIKVSTLNSYNCLGMVYATTTNIPEAWSGSNAKECLSMTTYDPFLGYTGNAWKTIESDIVIPSGCKMIVICVGNSQTVEESVSIYTTKLIPKFITADDIDNTIGNKFIRKTIFPIVEIPQVTTGTIQENTVKVKNNDKSYFWSFNQTGTMRCRLKFYCKSNDTVGVWLWFNFNQLNYSDNMDGVLSIDIAGRDAIQKNAAYSFKNGWNYVELGTFNEGYNDISMSIKYSLVRGDYVLGIDSVELNYKPYKKSKILLSFDMMSPTLYTVRYPLLKSYGFPATVCNVTRLTAQQRADIFADGWDWAIYSNGGISDLTIPSFTTGTEEEWTTFFKSVIEGYAEIGLFNPISYFSPNNRGSQILMNAEKKAGFRMSRIACSNNEKTGYFDKDSFFIYTLGVGGTDTSENINKQIDDTIAQNKSICIFTHDVEETVTNNMNCSREVYVGILNHIKELVEADKCEVVTFRQFYQLCEPNDYAELMAIRHEKEKAYILNKLV